MANEPLTADELAAIRARAEAATPGPWIYDGPDLFAEGEEWMQSISALSDRLAAHGITTELLALVPTGEYQPADIQPQSRHDAVFIAAAREDIPRLLDEILRLRAFVEDLLKWDEE